MSGFHFFSDVSGFQDQLQRFMLKYFHCIAATMKLPEFRKMKTELLSMKFTHNKQIDELNLFEFLFDHLLW